VFSLKSNDNEDLIRLNVAPTGEVTVDYLKPNANGEANIEYKVTDTGSLSTTRSAKVIVDPRADVPIRFVDAGDSSAVYDSVQVLLKKAGAAQGKEIYLGQSDQDGNVIIQVPPTTSNGRADTLFYRKNGIIVPTNRIILNSGDDVQNVLIETLGYAPDIPMADYEDVTPFNKIVPHKEGVIRMVYINLVGKKKLNGREYPYDHTARVTSIINKANASGRPEVQYELPNAENTVNNIDFASKQEERKIMSAHVIADTL
jgi:hypothetical protein